MLFVSLVALLVLVLAVRRLSLRVRELENRIAELASESAGRAQVNELSRRIGRLENSAAVVPIPQPVWKTTPEPVAQAEPEALPEITPVVDEIRPAETVAYLESLSGSASPEPVFAQAPRLTLADRVRGFFSTDEWEALVGGSVLNKAGAVVLVIGIALFLAYSWTHVSAAGRAILSYAVGALMLSAGVWTDRKAQYRTFARGLIGAGWAAIYATTYAIWAIPAARILPDPFAGSLALIAVAAAMIGHSLLYRSEAATGVAYAAAFGAVAVTPSSPVAIVALGPLSASLLYLAARFEWYAIALGAVVAAWGVVILKGASALPIADAQAASLGYWVIFELFDLLRTRRGATRGGVAWIYPVNAAALAWCCWKIWAPHDAHRLWVAASCGAALFLMDSIVRARLHSGASFQHEPLRERLAAGSYEASALISALLAGLAISVRVPAMWAVAGLALEAEAIYLSGYALRSPFLEALGGAAFVWSMLRMPFTPESYGRTSVFGYAVWNWVPCALANIFLFYFNRALSRRAAFSYAAVLVVACVLVAQAPDGWAGTLALVYAFILLEISVQRAAADFKWQAYALLFAGTVFTTAWDAPGPHAQPLAVAIALAVMYACALRSRWLRIAERREFAYASSAAVTLLAIMLAWLAAPFEYAAAAVCVASVAALELGALGLPSELAAFSGPTLLIGAVGLLFSYGLPAKPSPSAVWISFGIASACSFAGLIRWVRSAPLAVPRRHIPILEAFTAAFGSAAAMIAIRAVAPDAAVTPLWMLLAIGLVEFGAAFKSDAPRYAGLVITAISFLRILDRDLRASPWISVLPSVPAFYWLWSRFQDPARRILFWLGLATLSAFVESVGVLNAAAGQAAIALVLIALTRRFELQDAELQAILIGLLATGQALVTDISPDCHVPALIVVAACWFGAYAIGRSPRTRDYFSVLGAIVTAGALYGEVSGGLLTVSWALEGLALLAGGFAARERVLRIEGLAALFICILKVFFYDLRNLETFYRILSFIGLGVILLSVSWIYTRFHEHLKRLL